MGPAYPELVVQRHGAATLEDALRDSVRNMPYLGIALLVHLAVLFVFMQLKSPVLVPDIDQIITSSPTDTAVIEPPVDLSPPEPIEQPTEMPVEPTITEFDPVEAPPIDSNAIADADMLSADVGLDSVIGLGIGPEGTGSPGRGGPSGGGHPASPSVDDAVRDALLWLKHHQDPVSGHWSAEGFDLFCSTDADVICDGRGNPRYDVGVTGLALLAFLGAGNTDRSGDFQSTVKRGLRYLVDIQADDGDLAPPTSTQGTYDHVIGTLALVEAYSYSPHSTYLKKPAAAALRKLHELRTPGSGWRYTPGHPEMRDPARSADTSVTGWAVLTMSAARKAGLYVDPLAWDDALAFLDEMGDPATGRTGYIERGGPVARELGTEGRWPASQSEAMTAVGLLCRVFDDPDLSDPHNRDMVEKATRLLEALPPVWDDAQTGRRDYYGWYYGAYALYQVGGVSWRRWERALLDGLLGQQHKDGERKGSWDPQHDPWGHAGGRVYTTAINTLTLEVYYRYDRLLGGGR